MSKLNSCINYFSPVGNLIPIGFLESLKVNSPVGIIIFLYDVIF